MDVYRFRSMDALLDKHHELENQTIYFASPEELNDPMEGFRDIVWRGDKIVWERFFKHYVYCLHATYFQFRLVGPFVQLNADRIPILGRWDGLPAPLQRMFNEIWGRFLDLPKISEFIVALSNTDRKIRYRELRLYLDPIHSAIIDEIEEVCPANEHMSETTIHYTTDGLPTVGQRLESILTAMAQLDEDQDEEKTNAVLSVIEGMNRATRIELQLSDAIPTEILRQNIQLVLCDFPNIYLKEIENLLWFNWRTACFMTHYHNSSAWGHYAAGHKGACLIFESAERDGSHQLELRESADIPARKFREVVYGGKLNEVDFFRSIGRSTVEQLRELWYTDTEGNISECAAHLPRDGEIDNENTIAWRKQYWGSFYRDITSKTKDWKYEQEWRLILDDRSGGFDEEKGCKLTYDFNSLKGIIFGIGASDEDISRVVKIIQKKCKKHERTDFKFYQAEYSPETGDIRKY